MSGQDKRTTIWLHAWQDEDSLFGMILKWREEIQQLFDVVTYKHVRTDPELAKQIQGAIIIGPTYKFFKEQFPLMTNLKVLANFGVGVNHLDVGMYAGRGVVVCNTPEVLANAVADMALGLLIASARNIYPGAREAMEDPQCSVFGVNDLGVEVTGSTLGIVGMGSIGHKIALRAKAFDMRIVYHNRKRRTDALEKSVGATFYPTLSEMLPHCDFVMVICPLTDETEKLFGEKEFSLMKPTSTLINVARGQIVDQDALLTALQKRDIRAAALDVTYPEPLPRDHPLLKLDNILITPHYGSATNEARLGMLRANLASLKAVLLDGSQTIPNEVKP